MTTTRECDDAGTLAAECESLRRRVAQLEAERLAYLAQQQQQSSEQMAALAAANEELLKSERQCHELFEASADATLLLATDTGQIIEANARALALYGYGREELLTKRSTDLSAEPDETHERTQEAALAQGQLFHIPSRLHRKKDGTVFPVEINARSLCRKGQSVLLRGYEFYGQFQST